MAKFLLFLQSVVIAYYFGTGATTDVYFYCYSVVTLLSIFVNNLDASVLIPESMRLKEQEGIEASISFLNSFIVFYCLLGIVGTIIMFVSPVKIFLLVSNFEPESLEQNAGIITLFIPLFMLMISTNLIVNILTSYRYFTIPMVVAVVNGLLVLLFLFIFHDELDIRSAILGQLVAYVVNLLILCFILKRKLKWTMGFKRGVVTKRVLGNILYAQAGNATTLMSAYIPIFLLSGFHTGLITALTYGQKTAEIPNQLITIQSSAVLGIKLNELFAKHEWSEIDRVFRATSNFLIFTLVPVSFIMFEFSSSIISVIYERGQFGSGSVLLSTEFFKYFALLLPMLAINTLVARLFMASQKIKEAFAYQILFNIALMIVIFAGVRLWGPTGYPIALLILHLLNVLFCYLLTRTFFPFVSYTGILKHLALVVSVNIPVFLLVGYIKDSFQPINEVLAITLGCIVYFALVIILNSFIVINQDANQIVKKIIELLSTYVRPYKKFR